MADGTYIEWTDATWNIITGCSVVSIGCRHCYAMKLAGTRLKHDPSRTGLTIDTAAGPVWNGQVRFNEQWLEQPLRWRRPRRIFVCAHGDLFHESVTDDWLQRIFTVMALAPQHTFQVLTKRPKRALQFFMRRTLVNTCDALFNAAAGRWPLPNVWLGVSVENQATADERIPLLLQCPAVVRWISAEPLLGEVDLRKLHLGDLYWLDALTGAVTISHDGGMPPGSDYQRIAWVVAGGESGPGARPMHPDWGRSLRNQCAAAGVPFLFKQWGNWAPHTTTPGGDEGGDLRSGRVRYLAGDGRMPDGHFRCGDAAMANVGKKAAGRLLDGQLHNGYPA